MAKTEIVVNEINRLLLAGEAVKAADTIGSSIADVANEPESVLRVLEALDKQRLDTELSTLVKNLEDAGLLRQDCLTFQLRIKFRAGEYPACLEIINRLLQGKENDVEALRTAARIGNLTRDENLALQYWERLAQAAPNDFEAALQAARIRMRRRQFGQALDWAEHAVELRSGSAEPLQIAVNAAIAAATWNEDCDRLLAEYYAVDREQGLRAVAQLSSTFEAAIVARALAVLLRQFPKDDALLGIVNKACSQWLIAALEHELASRDLEAAACYCALRRVRPGDPDAKRALDRLSLPSLVAMRDEFTNRDFSGALEHGLMATRIDPDCLEAWQTVGRAQFSLGDSTAASESYRRCTELSPQNARVWLTYGLILNQAGDRPTALTAFQNARRLTNDAEIRREADTSIAVLHPALIRDVSQSIADGRIAAAWVAYHAAAAINTSGDMLQTQRDLLRATREEIRRLWNSKSEGVVPLCREYLKESADERFVLAVLARTLMQTYDYSEALPLWERLCKLDASEEAHYQLQIARCCRALGIVEKGVHAAELAYRLDPALQEAVDIAKSLGASPPSGPATDIVEPVAARARGDRRAQPAAG